MNMDTIMTSILLNNLEGFFFGSGKAHVVTGVALMILCGLAISLWRMDRKLSRLEDEVRSQKP
jgi:hypothetical protein